MIQGPIQRSTPNVNWPPFLLNLVSKVHKREIDPKRAARVYREYDVRRGYAHYGDFCRQRFERMSQAWPAESLKRQGFVKLAVLDADLAGRTIAEFQSKHTLVQVKKDSQDLLGFPLKDPHRLEALLRQLLTSEVEGQLLGYFESEYLVHSVTFVMTPAAEEQNSVSFKWHCDKGPQRHLKMMVYLNATDAHVGNTQFINLEETAALARRGYVFGLSRDRTGNIGDLARIAGHPLTINEHDMAAGDALIFQPARVLHRGLSPRAGPRFVITLCLLPSPLPWEEALARGTMTDLSESPKWHRNASELYKLLI